MIDYFLRWNTSSEAKADALSAAQKFGFQLSSGWAWGRDHVIPDVRAWRPSQDVVTTIVSTVDGTTYRTIVHNYLTDWFAIVSLNNQVSVLLNSSELAFALDRDGPPYVIRNNIGAVISDVVCSPVFAGSHYPIGGYST